MVCETFHKGDSVIHRLDPRLRVVAAFVVSALLAVSDRFPVLWAGLAIGIAMAAVARLPAAALVRRLCPLNAFMLLLFLLLPLATPGVALLRVGPFGFSEAGASLAAAVTLKANAIMLCLTALLSTMELVTLGHAFSHLRVPDKLTHLFLFTVRYIDVLHHEYARLVKAMRVRCFRARMSLHTYRAVGWLVGMLLVKSFDRADRISAAMKCRGFRGRFYVLHHFAFGRRDAVFGVVSLLVLAVLLWAELQ